VNLEGYHNMFIAGSLILTLVAAAPLLSLIIAFPGESERFSELWLLDSDHIAENYPFNVQANETYNLFVGVSNHMGSLTYYMVYVKFRNQAQPIPDMSGSKPSSLPPLYEFQFFVRSSEIWESLLTFEISDVHSNGDSLSVGNVSINGVPFSVNCTSIWDSRNNGFYYQLFLELWLYNTSSQSFQYHDHFVGIWLNMTTLT